MHHATAADSARVGAPACPRPLRRLRAALAFAALALGVAPAPRSAQACAPVYRPDAAVRVVDEEALIVWDEAHRTEHFIRRADFETAAADFGFVVPTPSQPTMTEAPDAVFTQLARIYSRPRRSYGGGGGGGLRSARPVVAAVQVVSVTRVAGLEATVLRASDAGALSAWLANHGYATRPGFTAWLAPYVQRRWFVTAFRYAPGGRPRFGSQAVRMSFRTDRPFFPYSEPLDQPQTPGRTFRVSVVAPRRVDALLGRHAWSARVGYAGQPTTLSTVLGSALPPGVRQPGPWLTTFEERGSTRGLDDLFFRPSAATGTVPASL